VLLVAPVAELAEQSRDAHLEQALEAQLEPLQRELIPVYHARAAELAELLLASLADDGILAGRGSLSVDSGPIPWWWPSRQNGSPNCASVAQLDVPVRQVMIEARIVEANVDYEKAWVCAGEALVRRQQPGGELFVDLGGAGTSGSGGLLRSVTLLLDLGAMEKSGNGEIISQPKVVTDKETARILKGTEVPYQETTRVAPPRCRSARPRCRWK
jgi:type IV pilus assembly protein PilQ